MKILVVSDVYFPRINGVSTSIRTFSRELKVRGHEVLLIAPDYEMGPDGEDPVLRVPSRGVMFDPEDRMMKRSAIRELIPALRDCEFDIVHIQTPFVAHYAGVALARTLGLPCVETYHTFFEEYLFHYVPFLPRALLRFAARRLSAWQCNEVDAVVVPSTPMRDALHAYGVKSRLEIIPTGIQLEDFNDGNGLRFREKHAIAPDRPTLVYVGRVAFEKNIPFLLNALVEIKKLFPNVLLIIAGEGPARDMLHRMSTRLGLDSNVLFVGYLRNPQELHDCYCAGDIFVFSSRTETQGLVLLEAMALGVPVVSTAVMGTKDILRAGRGALIAQEDIDDFAEHIVLLLQDAELRRCIGEDGKAYVGQWSAGEMAERMIGFYHDIIVQRRRVEITRVASE